MKPYCAHEYGQVYCCDALPLMTTLAEEGRRYPLQIHDIPYDVSVSGESIDLKDRTPMQRDFGDWDQKIDLDMFAVGCSSVAADDANCLVFFNNWYDISHLVKALDAFFDRVTTLVWAKTNPRPQVRKRNFVMAHELLVLAQRGRYTFNFTDHSGMFSVLHHSVASGKDRLKDAEGKTLHATQKPASLVKYYIERLSKPGDCVLDAYAGCLTTAVAAVRSRRRFCVNELNPLYLDAGIAWLEEIP